MLTEKDRALIDFLLRETDKGRIKWEPTARTDEFTTSFKGKYNITIDRSVLDESRVYYWLKLKDVDDQELLSVSDFESDEVHVLFDLAKRRALSVDAAIDEIMGGSVTDEDIPF